MITHELIEFIKKQDAAGKSRDELSQVLIQHGWAKEDVDEAFMQVGPLGPAPVAAPVQPQQPVQPIEQVRPIIEPAQPVQTVQQPIVQPQSIQQPVMQPVQQPAQPVQPMQQPVMMQSVAPAGPSVATGFMAIAASTIFSAVLLMLIVKIMKIGSLIPLNNPWIFFVALPVISLLFSAVALSVTTRLLRVPGASFAKASVFVSIQMALVALMSFLVSLITLPRITVFAATLVLWFVIFIGYYHASFLKALATFLLNAVFTTLIGIAIAIIVGMLGFGLISSLAGSLGGKLIQQATSQSSYQAEIQDPAPIVF